MRWHAFSMSLAMLSGILQQTIHIKRINQRLVFNSISNLTGPKRDLLCLHAISYREWGKWKRKEFAVATTNENSRRWWQINSNVCTNFKRNNTVKPRYDEALGTMKITLLYQVSCYIRVKNQRNIKSCYQQNDLVIRGFCYIRPLYNEVPLY